MIFKNKTIDKQMKIKMLIDLIFHLFIPSVSPPAEDHHPQVRSCSDTKVWHNLPADIIGKNIVPDILHQWTFTACFSMHFLFIFRLVSF